MGFSKVSPNLQKYFKLKKGLKLNELYMDQKKELKEKPLAL